jgi:hypothetical protein
MFSFLNCYFHFINNLIFMRNKNIAINGIIAGIALFIGITVNGQNSECKVLLPEIAGSYTGDCKNGLANGKGIAQGIDRYEGQFSKGMPQGRGKYTWANGSVYNGQWVKGLKEGQGEMVHSLSGRDSTVKGYWKNDKYIGEKLIAPYTIIRKDDLLACNLRKTGEGNEVIVKLMMKGQINTRVRGLSMVYGSGTQFRSGPHEGVQNIYFPFDLKITYTTSNPISRSSFDVVFECTITEPGKWEIILNN